MVASRIAAWATLALAFLPVSAGADTAVQVFDLNDGLARGVNDVAHGAATFAGHLYFAGQSTANDVELWRYDGVNPPLIAASDINPAGSSDPSELIAFGALICFSAHDATFDRELYCRGNATPPSEIEINPTGPSNPMNFVVFDSQLYFSATGDPAGQELWRWDGINPPERVSDIAPGPPATPQEDSFDLDAHDDMLVWNADLYFVADDGEGDRELYRYDGVNPPVKVSDSDGDAQGDKLVVVGSFLYFAHSDVLGEARLWRYDGANPPVELSATLDVEGDLAAFGGNVYFWARETAPGSETGREMWRHDGATITRVSPSQVVGVVASWEVFSGALYFIDGAELYKYDGVAAPAAAVASFAGASDFPLNGFEAYGGLLYFAARHNTGGGGEELWALTPAPSPGPGTIQFSAAAYSVGEGAGTATVTLTRLGGSTGDACVTLVDAGTGTATPGPPGPATDYATLLPATAFWADGDSTPRDIDVAVIFQDGNAEPDETVDLVLSTSDENCIGQPGGDLGSPAAATLTILDDEAPASTGSAMWQPDSYVVFEETLATLTLVRTGDTSGPLTVEVRTVDGTASVFGPDFADYLTYINTVTWDAGDASPRQITIEIGGDGGTNSIEGPEEFYVELYQPSIASGNLVDTATVTILDAESVSEIPALGGPGLLALIALLGAAAFAFLRRA